MGFMQNEVVYKTFHQLYTLNEGICSYPAHSVSAAEVAKIHGEDIEDVETITGWFARMSAPGYLDCTEWCGPFETEEDAINHLSEMYGDDDDDDEKSEV